MSQTKIKAGGFDADVITGTTALTTSPDSASATENCPIDPWPSSIYASATELNLEFVFKCAYANLKAFCSPDDGL